MQKKKIVSVEYLRIISFLIIFLSHCDLLNYMWGSTAVSMFFVLSGYLMNISYKDKEIECNIKNNFIFAINKIEKLYPLHIFTMIVMIVLSFINIGNNLNLLSVVCIFLQTVSHVFLIQSWIPSSIFYFSLNGVAWFLSSLFFIYFMFTIIKNKINNNNVLKILIVTIIIMVGTGYLSTLIPNFYYFDNFQKWFTYIFPIYRLGDFILGYCMSLYFENKILNIKENLFILFLLVISFSIIYLTYYEFIVLLSAEWLKYTLINIPFVCLMVLFVEKNNRLFENNKFIIIKLSRLSGYCFLIHFMLIKSLIRIFKNLIMGSIKMGAICLILTICIAYIYDIYFNSIKFKN